MISAEIFVRPRRRISDVDQVPETDMIPYLVELWKALDDQLGSGSTGVDEIVYQSRKISKKIGALLLLIKNHIPRSAFDEMTNTLTFISRELAPVREYAVLKETCALFKRNILDEVGAIGYTRLEQQLEFEYHQLLHEKIVEEDTFRILRKHIQGLNASREIPALFLDNRDITWEAGKTYKRCRKLFENLSVGSSSKQFHQFRKCSKTLQYQLGILNKAGLGRIKTKRKLDGINRILGWKNDLNVFINYLKHNSREIYRQTAPFFKKEIKSMQRKILKEAGGYY